MSDKKDYNFLLVNYPDISFIKESKLVFCKICNYYTYVQINTVNCYKCVRKKILKNRNITYRKKNINSMLDYNTGDDADISDNDKSD